LIPTYKYGDVIVATGNLQREEVVVMDKVFYTNVDFAAVWSMKYIFIPFGIAFFVRIFADKVSRPQPERQRKKRSDKDRLK